MDSNIDDIANTPIMQEMWADSLEGMIAARVPKFESSLDTILEENTTDKCLSKQNLTESLTHNALQKNWFTPTEFPLCPSTVSEQPLNEYLKNLTKGAIVTKNMHTTHFVDDFALCNNKLLIRTHANDGIKPYSLIYITFDNGAFIHEGTLFFEKIGAIKYFTLELGQEWDNMDVVDDFC